MIPAISSSAGPASTDSPSSGENPYGLSALWHDGGYNLLDLLPELERTPEPQPPAIETNIVEELAVPTQTMPEMIMPSESAAYADASPPHVRTWQFGARSG